MDVSLIICTYNRHESLRQTLRTVCELIIPDGLNWELLVVDNNSNDATRQVCESFKDRLPLRYLFEPKQGVSRARNLAISRANAPLLFFTDDDVNLDKEWFCSLWDAAQWHPEIGIFAGRILPLWVGTPPPWLTSRTQSMLRLVCSCLDLGDGERIVTRIGHGPWGASMVLRKSILNSELRFNERLGRCGRRTSHLRGGETELIHRLYDSGHKGLYVGRAIVHHRNPPSQGTERYVFRYYRGAGKTEIRLQEIPVDGRCWLGAPRYFWFKVLKHALQYGLWRWTRPPEVWLRAEIQMAKNWGRILELRRIGKNSHERSGLRPLHASQTGAQLGS
jgi:glycosyltransferase involved in cell wall biosynthesis